jgi:hypothetical protein
MEKDGEPPEIPKPPAPTEELPPYNPDPDLITYLEREAKPGEVKVWRPDEGE